MGKRFIAAIAAVVVLLGIVFIVPIAKKAFRNWQAKNDYENQRKYR